MSKQESLFSTEELSGFPPRHEPTQERMLQLVREIAHHDQQYYRHSLPAISDQEYDALRRELKAIEAAHPEWVLPHSPTQQVGDDRAAGFAKVRHAEPMLSLENTYSLDDLQAFGTRVHDALGHMPELICELKYDGVAISVTYIDGVLARAVTRGNGQEGDDVTSNVRTIASLPLELRGEDVPSEVEFRGEIFMPRLVFETLNAEREQAGKPPFINPRNTASGSLKLHDPRAVLRRKLDCTIYYVASTPPIAATHTEALARAASWGLPVSERLVRCATVEALFTQIEQWGTLRPTLPFDTDGVVVKVNSYADQRTLGLTTSSPRWAIAYKYPSLPVSTRLLEVQFQVGRTGTVVPVAVLERVPLGGVYVQRATLHNADQLARLDLHYGDTVLVERGGEVIPKVVAVQPALRPEGAQPVTYPTHCPACGTPLQRIQGNAATYCPNALACPAQQMAALIHFVSKQALDIDWLGESTVQTLYEHGLVRTIEDLYTLTHDALQRIERFRDHAATGKEPDRKKAITPKLLAAIEASKRTPLSRLLLGLGIRQVGASTARTLALHFGEIDALMAATQEELAALPDVGEEVAASIARYFSTPANAERIARLRSLGVTMREVVDTPTQTLQGEHFVVSGKVHGYSREAIHDLIRRAGGRVQSSLASSTTYLVAGEKMSASKRKAAERLGVPIITPERLFELINPETDGTT